MVKKPTYEALEKKIQELEKFEALYNKTEKALRQSEEKFESIANNAVDYIFIKNKDRKYTFINRAMQNLLGIKKEEILGRSPEDIFGFEQGEIVKELDNRTFLGETVNETRSLIIGGEKYYFNTVQTHLSIENGEITAIMGIVRDVTEAKIAEEALLKSEEKYRNLFETMTQGVIIQGADGRVIEANLAASELLGLSLDQLLGKTACDPRWRMIHEDGSPYDPAEMPSNIALQTGKPSKGVPCGIYVPEIDKYRWVEIGSVPRFKDGETKPFVTTTVFTDITEHKRNEKKIKKSLKEKEILLRELYHRTKNNMQVIMAMINLQTQNIKNENILQKFNVITNRISTIALVHEMLYQTKDLSTINLKDYFTDLINLLLSKQQNIHEGISIKRDMKDVLVTIDSAITCGLIMDELISNIFKHAYPENSGGEIQISLKITEEQEIEFIVGDDGIGLPEGFDYRNSDTMGFQTLVGLAEGQLLGSLTLVEGKGVSFQIRFKENPHPEKV